MAWRGRIRSGSVNLREDTVHIAYRPRGALARQLLVESTLLGLGGAALKAGSRGSDAPRALRWRNVLVVAQVAMSLVLLVGAGLFLRSWQQTLALDPGFGSAPMAILSVMMPVRQSAPDEAVQRARLLLERFRALTGVAAAGLIQPLPLELSFNFTDFTIDGRVPPAGQQTFRADSAFVDGGFFDAAGMDIVEGRTFNDDDRLDSQPVAVISRAMRCLTWRSSAWQATSWCDRSASRHAI